MNITHEKLIRAVIEKSRKICPKSLALVGIYGSTITGDAHPKSDLDLLILINDPRGYALADAFILENDGIAYDLYCTTWQMLENDAEVPHARLAKLMDSKFVYVNDESAMPRLTALREKAKQILTSDDRFTRADSLLTQMKIAAADGICAESLGESRKFAAQAVNCALDSVMLYNGRYFRKGIKRTFDELEPLPQPENFRENIEKITLAEDKPTLTNALIDLLKSTAAFLTHTASPVPPTPDSLKGTAEEMYSNWKNKLPEAAKTGDAFTSFMTLAAFQSMLDEVTAGTTLPKLTLLGSYTPADLENNAHLFDSIYNTYVRSIAKFNVTPQTYKSADDFVKSYLTQPKGD